MIKLTRVIGVMLSVAEDFKGTGEVKQVHILVHGEENLNGFILVAPNCTHFAG